MLGVSQPASRNDTFVFVHVPKTGGTTVASILKTGFVSGLNLSRFVPALGVHPNTLYSATEIFASPRMARVTQAQLAGLSTGQRSAIRFLSGHIAHGYCELFVNGPCHYITVLREPWSLVISQIKWTQKHSPELSNYSVSEFVEQTLDPRYSHAMKRSDGESVVCTLHDNHMTRLLSGEGIGAHWLASQGSYTPCGRLTTLHFHKAWDNLRKFLAVGLLEDLQPFVAQLNKATAQAGLHFSYNGSILNKNQHETNPQLSSRAEKILQLFTKFDTMLYNAAKHQLEALSGLDVP